MIIIGNEKLNHEILSNVATVNIRIARFTKETCNAFGIASRSANCVAWVNRMPWGNPNVRSPTSLRGRVHGGVVMKFKSKEDYLKEIAEEINNAQEKLIENPTVEDVLSLEGFDSIVTDGAYFPVIIRRKYTIDTILNVPTVMWHDGYEIGDTVMGIIPITYSAEEVLEELKGFRN